MNILDAIFYDGGGVRQSVGHVTERHPAA